MFLVRPIERHFRAWHYITRTNHHREFFFPCFLINFEDEIKINRRKDFGSLKVLNNMNYVKMTWQDIYQVN